MPRARSHRSRDRGSAGSARGRDTRLTLAADRPVDRGRLLPQLRHVDDPSTPQGRLGPDPEGRRRHERAPRGGRRVRAVHVSALREQRADEGPGVHQEVRGRAERLPDRASWPRN